MLEWKGSQQGPCLELPDLEGLVFKKNNQVELGWTESDPSDEGRFGLILLANLGNLSGPQIDQLDAVAMKRLVNILGGEANDLGR
jgi:hypothetical protein